jgi:hypothetical protein
VTFGNLTAVNVGLGGGGGFERVAFWEVALGAYVHIVDVMEAAAASIFRVDEYALSGKCGTDVGKGT